MDGREAAWRAWCGRKGIDADPTVDKVWEYVLDVTEGQKTRVSRKKGRGPAPWHGCCTSDIHCVCDYKRIASATAWHAPIGSILFVADLHMFVLVGGTAILAMRSSPLAQRHFWDGRVCALLRLPSCEPGTLPAIPGFPPTLTITLLIALASPSLPRSPVSMLTHPFKGLCVHDLSLPLFLHYCCKAAARHLIVEMSLLWTLTILSIHSKVLIVWIFYHLTNLLANRLVDLIWWFFLHPQHDLEVFISSCHFLPLCCYTPGTRGSV